MKVVFGFLAAVALVLSLGVITTLALVVGIVAADDASAQCVGSGCGAVLVPAPNPIQMRRLKVRPLPPLAATCGPGCVNATNAYASPPPCGQSGCGGTAFIYFPKRFYPLDAAGPHDVLSGCRQLLLAQGLLVRFLRPPLLLLG
jgi:hypothetical protein